MEIKPITSLTEAEIRDLAHAAADSSEPAHDACPAGLTVEQQNDFHGAYVERRHELVGTKVRGQGFVCADPV